MRTRFGTGVGAELAYLSVVVYCAGQRGGIPGVCLPGDRYLYPGFPSVGLPYAAEVYATVILLVTGIYCVVGGMYSVVLNDLIQYSLIFVRRYALPRWR